MLACDGAPLCSVNADAQESGIVLRMPKLSNLSDEVSLRDRSSIKLLKTLWTIVLLPQVMEGGMDATT